MREFGPVNTISIITAGSPMFIIILVCLTRQKESSLAMLNKRLITQLSEKMDPALRVAPEKMLISGEWL